MNLTESRHASATRLAEQLAKLDLKIVFAESCTAGLIAATLGAIPGISRHLCGSAVTYRAGAKSSWLNVDSQTIEEFSAESKQVTDLMAINVLKQTPEAGFSAAVTGHLGPDAPSEKDGVIFVAVARRTKNELQHVSSIETTLKSASRSDRQEESVITVLEQVLKALRTGS